MNKEEKSVKHYGYNPSSGINFKANPLIQYRNPVGCGPSLKT